MKVMDFIDRILDRFLFEWSGLKWALTAIGIGIVALMVFAIICHNDEEKRCYASHCSVGRTPMMMVVGHSSAINVGDVHVPEANSYSCLCVEIPTAPTPTAP